MVNNNQKIQDVLTEVFTLVRDEGIKKVINKIIIKKNLFYCNSNAKRKKSR